MKKERARTATLSFPLPECREEFAQAIRAQEVEGAIFDFSQWLRCQLEYAVDKGLHKKTIEAVQKKFRECLAEITLDL